MEKTIIIDSQSIQLKSTAATPLRYKAQFKRDFFSELLKLAKLFAGQEGTAEDVKEDGIDLSKISWEALDHLDFEVFYNFVWVLAKSADHSIPDPLDWLDQFDEFPIKEIFPQITDLLSSSIQSKKK